MSEGKHIIESNIESRLQLNQAADESSESQLKNKLNQLRKILVNECQLRSLSYQYILLACERANFYYSEGYSFESSINAGLSFIEELTCENY